MAARHSFVQKSFSCNNTCEVCATAICNQCLNWLMLDTGGERCQRDNAEVICGRPKSSEDEMVVTVAARKEGTAQP